MPEGERGREEQSVGILPEGSEGGAHHGDLDQGERGELDRSGRGEEEKRARERTEAGGGCKMTTGES